MSFSFRNTLTQYGLGGRILHWTSVTLLVTLILTADGFDGVEKGPLRDTLVSQHASWGLLFILVMTSRVYWRVSNHNPVRSYSIANWQKFAAITLHWSIYIVVITQSVSGLFNLFFSGAGIPFFSFFESTPFMQRNEALFDLSNSLHYVLSIVIYPLFGIHISAAIYHQLFGVLDDDE